jgi:hypothetical protein
MTFADTVAALLEARNDLRIGEQNGVCTARKDSECGNSFAWIWISPGRCA